MGVGEFGAAQEQFHAALVAELKSTAVLYLQLARASFGLEEYFSARAFLERMFGAGGVTADSLLLAVRTERKLGVDDLAKEYAARLRSAYPGSEQIEQLNVLMSEGDNG